MISFSNKPGNPQQINMFLAFSIRHFQFDRLYAFMITVIYGHLGIQPFYGDGAGLLKDIK